MFTSVNNPMFIFVAYMKMETHYSDLFRSDLNGRYVTYEHIKPLLDTAVDIADISVAGFSEEGIPIPKVTLGNGPNKVLAWSQMHGNESTTTKALFDFLLFLGQKVEFQLEIQRFLSSYTFVFLPILNPDGAKQYTRENANGIDLNRDAVARTQVESRILWEVFDSFQPQLCLNLHDQRSIYGTPEGISATISFLSPSQDVERAVTDTRKVAMSHIVRIEKALKDLIPGHIARYDDIFNENCVGDSFTRLGVPTVLIEAGHFEDDYDREHSRELVFYSFLELFEINEPAKSTNYRDYFKIPENKKNFKDVILRNARFSGSEALISIGIQYEEVLKNGKINFIPVIDSVGDLNAYFAHSENDCEGASILLNYHKKATIGEKIVIITDEFDQNIVFYSKK